MDGNENLENKEDQEQEQEQNQSESSESMIARLKEMLEKQQDQIERQNQSYRELRSETDSLKSTTANEIAALLRSQTINTQHDDSSSFDSINDPDKLLKYTKDTAKEIRRKYSEGELSEEEKDALILDINIQYADRKAQILANQAMERAKQEYDSSYKKTTAESEWQNIYKSSGLADSNSDVYKKFMELAQEGLFDYERARTDPSELQRGLKITNKMIGNNSSSQQTKQNNSSFSAPTGATGDALPTTTSDSVNPYFNSQSFKEIEAILINKHGAKIAGQLVKQIKSNYTKGN